MHALTRFQGDEVGFGAVVFGGGALHVAFHDDVEAVALFALQCIQNIKCCTRELASNRLVQHTAITTISTAVAA